MDSRPRADFRQSPLRRPATLPRKSRSIGSFNSWGEKYGAYDLDDAVPRRLGERYGFEVVEPGIVLEGGSIDVNGEGSCSRPNRACSTRIAIRR